MSQEPSNPARRVTRRNARSLAWNDAAIEQAAAVGPEDADAAEASWRRHGPSGARNLLSAEEEDDDER